MIEYPDNIELVLVYQIDKEYYTEKVNAKKIDIFYQILSVPSFAKNLAYGDIVKVELDEDEYHFEELVKESGHSVIHIVFFNLSDKEEIITTLEEFGCRVNTNIADNYLAIDIPPLITYLNIKAYLDKQQMQNILDYSESCLSYFHKEIENS